MIPTNTNTTSFSTPPALNPEVRKMRMLHSMLHSIVTGRDFLRPFVSFSCPTRKASENEKTLEITRKTRVFISEVDGARTRNLRIDSPVL
jgi:hypothetical protein